jgi:hypothetical protein
MGSMVQPELRLPGAAFAARKLPVEIVKSGTAFLRLHRLEQGAIHFGRSGENRFDDPQGGFGVCYVARNLEGAFAETCLRDVGAQFVSRSFLEARAITILRLTGDLRLVRAHGPGLARLGVTSALSAGPYEISQAWARAMHDHPVAPDGLLYRSNHDNSQLCAGLFDRCQRRLSAEKPLSLLADRVRLAKLFDRYKVALG